jgi:hypothetical protein
VMIEPRVRRATGALPRCRSADYCRQWQRRPEIEEVRAAAGPVRAREATGEPPRPRVRQAGEGGQEGDHAAG